MTDDRTLVERIDEILSKPAGERGPLYALLADCREALTPKGHLSPETKIYTPQHFPIPLVVNNLLPDNCFEFRHPDGRVDRFVVVPSPPSKER